ncbi:MAG: hypothetical protein GY804_03770 [Alphaproteobacteria bacterium]|nr:hypothetical protein [Alphaproteobacteria bacterium]
MDMKKAEASKQLIDNLMEGIFKIHGHEVEWVDMGGGYMVMVSGVEGEELFDVGMTMVEMSEFFFSMSAETLASAHPEETKIDSLRKGAYAFMVGRLLKIAKGETNDDEIRKSFITKVKDAKAAEKH